MPENYFDKFPLVQYGNTTCRDLTRRVQFNEKTRNALTLYYTYDVKDGMRTDLIADAYYDDPSLDWLIWMTNFIVDPYYQWNLSERDFNNYLVKKYGSVEASIKKIAFYRNNWYDDSQTISTSFYDNHLEQNWKKYYSPFYGQGTDILYWVRREEDWTMETNKIYKLTVANTEPFIEGELVDVTDTSANRVGGGEITAVSNTYIMIKNIDGSFANNDTVTGEQSSNGQTVTDTALVYEAITNDEEVFWSPVTYYDIENEKNAYNRTINILDASHLKTVTRQLSTLLQE